MSIQNLEYIMEVDQQGKELNSRPKSDLANDTFGFKASLIIPKLDDGRYVLGLRSKKPPYPNTWMCGIGGTLSLGETYFEAAVRESIEEVGINVKPVYVASGIHWDEKIKMLFEIYESEPVKFEDLKPDANEIDRLQAYPLLYIRRWTQHKPEDFAPTFLTAFDSFYDALRSQ